MAHILINCTHGEDDVERASLSAVVANTALTSGQQTTLMLTVEGVWLATRGYTEGLEANGFAPLGELLEQFLENDGQLWVCGACAKPRNITADDLITGAQMVGAAAAIEALANGAQSLSF